MSLLVMFSLIEASKSARQFCAFLTSAGWLKNPLPLKEYLPVFKHLRVTGTGRDDTFILLPFDDFNIMNIDGYTRVYGLKASTLLGLMTVFAHMKTYFLYMHRMPQCLLTIAGNRTMLAGKLMSVLSFCPFLLHKTRLSSSVREL